MSGADTVVVRRHGRHVHGHPYARPHRHLLLFRRSRPVEAHEYPYGHEHLYDHDHRLDDAHHHADGPGGHGHAYGLVARSIVRSLEAVKAVSISLSVLA